MMSRRPTKSSKTQPSGDFIALGSKRDEGGKSTASNIQRKVVPPSSAAATEARPVRRDSPALGLPQTKKPKHSMVQTLTPLGRPGELERRGSPLTQVYLFEENAKDVEPHDLLEAIEEAENSNDDENVERVICGAVKYLRANRSKPEQAMYLGLMYLAKTRPSFFGSEVIIECPPMKITRTLHCSKFRTNLFTFDGVTDQKDEINLHAAMSSLLKRDITIGFKAKGNPVIPVLSCNVLMAAFQDDDNWPDSFVKVYLEDSLGERIWVDRADCKAFVENIQSAFNTKIPKISTDAKSEQTIASAGASPAHTGLDDEEQMDTDISKVSAVLEDVSSMVSPRYTYQQVNIETYVLDMIRDQLNRRQAMDGALRNTVKLMMCTCGYAEVRNMAVQRIEMWLQNPKLTKPAQDLLMSVCMNCDQHSTQDIEIISQLSRVRLKNKHILLHYMQCMRELINQHADNLKTLMTHVIYNELSQSRNPNNMAVLAHMFSHASERAAKTMALIFQDLLCNKEDYVRALRALFREIVRSVRQDMSFTEFALGLMEERSDTKFKELEQPGKDRLLFALTDLICLTAYMSVSPTVRETAAANARGEQKDIEVLHQFQQNTAVIQRDAVWWLHTVVPKMFTVEPKLYVSYLRRVLFLDNSDAYHKMDNWPPEGDRSLLLRLVSEVPVLEDTLMRVLVIGLTRELRVAPSESIDIAELLVRRAALTYMEDFPVLKVERLEMVDALFHLSTYKHPENATFPKGYQPPTMAISTLYWKSWMILLIICSFNPETFGQAAWDNYPILRCLMEMIMTSNYVYPAPTMGTDEGLEEIKSQERQAAELEKQSILEFESYLAAGSRKEPINDSNSLLLKSLTNLDPSGPARKPPKEVLDGLEKLNQRMKIGQLLCRSRKPDFLMDIIKRQGTSQSMPWLADLVEGSESSLDILPVQCLCEFLLLDSNSTEGGEEYIKDDGSKVKSRPKKQQQLLARLQTLLHSPSSETRTIMEMLDYFLHRLSSQQSVQRQQAVKGLSVVLTKSHVELSSHFDIMEDEEDDEKMEIESSSLMKELREYRWLLEQLPSLPQFDDVKPHVCTALRKHECFLCLFFVDRPTELPVPYHGLAQYSTQVHPGPDPNTGLTPGSEPVSQKSSRAPSPVPTQNYDALEGQFTPGHATPNQQPTPVKSPSGPGFPPVPPPGDASGMSPLSTSTGGIAGKRVYPQMPSYTQPGIGGTQPPPPPGPQPGTQQPMMSTYSPQPNFPQPGVMQPPPPQPGIHQQPPPPQPGMHQQPPPPQPGMHQQPPPHPGVQQPQPWMAGGQQPGPGYQPTMGNNIPPRSTAGMVNNFGNMSLQPDATRPINLLQEKIVIPSRGIEPLIPNLPSDYKKVNCNPDVFRCTLNAIPNAQSLLNKSRLPLGILIHPFKDLSQLPVIQSSVIVRCRSCRTYINPFVTFVDSRRWKCNLCYRVNELPEEFSYDPVSKTYGDPQRRPEIRSATIEFIAPSEYMLRPPQPAVYLYILDVSFNARETGYLEVFCQTVLDELERIPGDSRTQIGFITFDRSLHFYNLQEGLSQPQMMVVSDVDDVFLPIPEGLLANMSESKELITDLLTSLPNMFKDNMETGSALGPALQAAYKLMSQTGGRASVFQTQLPTVGPGALKNREDPNDRTGKKVQHLGPAVDFYKKLALDCSAQQIAVDMFMLNGQYSDLATIAGISKYSGGCFYYFPGLHTKSNPAETDRFEGTLRRYLTRKIGFESVMRIRCSRGLSIHTFHGNFFVRSTDLLSLPNINPDAGFGMQMSIEDTIETNYVCFQAALLYTSSKGERRIRVHTLCIPVTNSITEIYSNADQLAICGLIAKMAVDKSLTQSMGDARDALVNSCIDMLSAYGNTLTSSQRMGQLPCPYTLRLMPLYILAFLKYTAFKVGSATKLDDRVNALESCKTMPLSYFLQEAYPYMYPVHMLDDNQSISKGDTIIPQPDQLHLSAAYMDRHGAYIMDLGSRMYLWIGGAVSDKFCQDVFDVPTFQAIPEGISELPELDNPTSERLRNFVSYTNDQRPFPACFHVIREDSRMRNHFVQHLVDDRTESTFSYYEFLQHLQKEVK